MPSSGRWSPITLLNKDIRALKLRPVLGGTHCNPGEAVPEQPAGGHHPQGSQREAGAGAQEQRRAGPPPARKGEGKT